MANEVPDLVDHAGELPEVSISGKQNSAMHDGVPQGRKVIKSFVLILTEASAEPPVQKVAPRRMLPESVIHLMELKLIYESIPAKFLPRRLEPLADLLN